MSRSLLLPLVLLVSAPVLAQDKAAPPSPGTIEVPDFRGVAVSHGLRAEVKPGARSVRLEGRAEDLARIKLEVKDGILTTRVDKGSWFSSGIRDVRLYVTNPRIEHVSASGGAHVDAEVTPASELELEASGGGELLVAGVDTKKLEVEASGGAEVTLRGRAAEMKVEGSGGSTIQARKVQVETLEVEASGGTHVEASPTQQLRGELSGGSTVKAGSKPAKVQVERSGGSEVDYE
ncbi:head GIN domain-containing protein [Cystobacter ferrugineus]|uniref:Putative auto-transporter adhesin head GIN domain-containing protein n=1 Tax=Cystobacter ferrugineus TaxID=83449 RepID=A0A1L9B0Z0_9BACT|nr:head GIN domain-containing protein [Cystobacter ferrugineus]OJH35833.1 hypothetical protein BON30_37485 [Cystobacter ferrugineus]